MDSDRASDPRSQKMFHFTKRKGLQVAQHPETGEWSVAVFYNNRSIFVNQVEWTKIRRTLGENLRKYNQLRNKKRRQFNTILDNRYIKMKRIVPANRRQSTMAVYENLSWEPHEDAFRINEIILTPSDLRTLEKSLPLIDEMMAPPHQPTATSESNRT